MFDQAFDRRRADVAARRRPKAGARRRWRCAMSTITRPRHVAIQAMQAPFRCAAAMMFSAAILRLLPMMMSPRLRAAADYHFDARISLLLSYCLRQIATRHLAPDVYLFSLRASPAQLTRMRAQREASLMPILAAPPIISPRTRGRLFFTY